MGGMTEERIVLYPAPAIGHIISMVELAKYILQHHNHYSFTILLTKGLMDHPSVDAYIERVSKSYPSISFHRLPHIPLPTTFPDPSASLAAIAFNFIKHNTPNVIKTLSTIPNVKAFVIDLFCSYALQPASSLGIPVFYFFTSGAAVLSLFCYLPKIHQHYHLSFKDMPGVELRVPGNAPFKAVHMPEPVLDRDDGAYHEMLFFGACLPKATGIIVNSFRDLEPMAVKAVDNGACFPDAPNVPPPPVYYIGPLIAEPQQSDEATDSGKECLSWLDAQPRRSVVYLCFGSRGSFSVSQMNEIANGLEHSGHKFLWIVKRPTTDEETNHALENTTKDFDLSSVLPSGFIERTKDRGLVVKSWAPQVDVLSRDSVGAFVSHCGWNSVLEGVVAGVPMVAWPLYSEQHVNMHVMVEDMKVAVAVEQREEDGFVIAEEVERKVREVMDSESIRERSFEMKQKALAALAPSGSSNKALTSLVQSWNGKITH